MRKEWIISFVAIGILFLLIAIMTLGAGNGTVIPAIILTPAIAISMLGGENNLYLWLYLIVMILVFILYGRIVSGFKGKKFVAILWVFCGHVFLV